jgi:hypothetical protein
MKISSFSFNYDQFLNPSQKKEEDRYDLELEVKKQSQDILTEQRATKQGPTCEVTACGWSCRVCDYQQ